MFTRTTIGSTQGLSLVEVIVASALIALVFGALLAGSQLLLEVVGSSKAKSGALALASEHMEYTRSFSYNDLGTVSGVPPGVIPQYSTTTLNDLEYTIRTLVQYVDDDADGVGGADSNGILADYKQVKVEVSWFQRGETDSLALVSNVVPPGIETTAGGGTIRVNVFDADVIPVAGAEVLFVNDSLSPSISTPRYTDANGVAYLAGAPAGANYEIVVTKPGFSTDGTYVFSSSNPNPTTPPIAVLESQVSTMNFQIDELSTVNIATVDVPTQNSFSDTFSTTDDIFLIANTTLNSDSVILTGGPVGYAALGVAESATTSPGTITNWYMAEFRASTSPDTSVNVSLVYDNAGTLALVPDEDLPSNSSGFTSSPIDISSLDPATYSSLGLRTRLETASSTVTPRLHEWSLTYIESQLPVSGVVVNVTGDRSIGTDGASQPVIKNTYGGTTDAAGEWIATGVEFDVYDLSVTRAGYDIVEICPQSPLTVPAGEVFDVQVVLTPASSNMLRVYVSEGGGATPVTGANVRLQNTGVDLTSTTSLCGQVYFGSGLYADDGYQLTVTADGYGSQSFASTTVHSSSSVEISL